jgi:hypothetical protein
MASKLSRVTEGAIGATTTPARKAPITPAHLNLKK